jgi:hypothetical protein
MTENRIFVSFIIHRSSAIIERKNTDVEGAFSSSVPRAKPPDVRPLGPGDAAELGMGRRKTRRGSADRPGGRSAFCDPARQRTEVGKPTLVDASGKEHDWRAELVAALAKRQDANGSWVNRADSFMEGDANLVTGYGLLALAYARAKS